MLTKIDEQPFNANAQLVHLKDDVHLLKDECNPLHSLTPDPVFG